MEPLRTDSSEVAFLLEKIKEQSQIIDKLKEELEWLKKQVFGKKSEKDITISKEEIFLPGFEPAIFGQEDKKETPVKPHTRKVSIKSGKDTLSYPDDLPIEETILDIPEKEKICPHTGKPLVKIGEEVTQKLSYKPGQYYIKKIIRPKYSTPEKEIKTAELPETLLPRCLADESLLAEIFTKKFSDHLPLYRIAEILARDGILISRQLLCQWVLKCGKALAPLHRELHKKTLESQNVFIDETPIDMQAKGKVKTAYMWLLAGGKGKDPPYRLYHFKTNRKHEHAKTLIGDYKGKLHSDKYGAYATLAKENQFTWLPCWAHIRRKFYDAQSGDAPFREYMLRKIRYLFMLERVAWNRSPEERLSIRQQKEVPIIEELIEAVKEKVTQGKILPKSKLKEALGYFYSLIPYVKNYTLDADAKIDNNTAERAIRPLAIGRKNWLFMGSEEGGKAAAVLISLIQTCRAIKVNPQEYLEDVMRRLMSHPANKLEELLPDQWIPSA
jgi:transposase